MLVTLITDSCQLSMLLGTCRQELGLLMLLSACLHACFYIMLFPASSTCCDTRTSLYLGAGMAAWCLAIILGLASLPSLASSLSWREFRLLQSRLGWLCLLAATTHCLVAGMDWDRPSQSEIFQLKVSSNTSLGSEYNIIRPRLR